MAHVFHAITADGHRFDFCTADDTVMAGAIIRYRYRDASAVHFVGGLERTSADLLDGFSAQVADGVDAGAADEYARLSEAEAAALHCLDEFRIGRASDAARAAFRRLTRE